MTSPAPPTSSDPLDGSSRSEAPARGAPPRLVVLMPLFNDWAAAEVVVRRLDEVLASDIPGVRAGVILADDCSTLPRPEAFLAGGIRHLTSVEVLPLRRNLGHQRAIAIGLCHVFENHPCDAVLVMDADGEDRPEDVPRLVARFEELGRRQLVFAARTKRSETLTFRAMYLAYRLLHKAATGIAVRVGNFSIMPRRSLSTLVVVGELWNHYAAAVLKSRIPHEQVPIPRGRRVSGRSHMNLTALVTHGLSAISVFSETVGVRATAAAFALSLLLTLIALGVVFVKLGTDLATPGWATTAAGLSIVLVFQALTISGGLTLFMLSSRNNLGFLPLRDYAYFVNAVERVGPAGTGRPAPPSASVEPAALGAPASLS